MEYVYLIICTCISLVEKCLIQFLLIYAILVRI